MSVVARERVAAARASEALETDMVPVTRSARSVAPTVAGVSALMVVSLLLGAQRLRTHYWIDEALTIGIAQHSIPSIPSVLVRDGSPPLYYLLLAAWTRVFGTGEVATHSLSLLFAVACVPVAFWAADRVFGRRAAWFASVFAGLCPFLTYFAGESRMYSLVVLESLLCCAAFSATFIDRRRNAAWWFAASLTALVYTHYWGLYAAAGAGLACALLAVRGDRRGLRHRVAIGFGVPALAFVPWLPTFVKQAQSTGAPWSHTPTPRGVVSEVAALVRDERVLIAIVLAVGIGLAPLVVELVRDGLATRNRGLQKTIALVCIGIVPVAIGWSLSHLQPSWATRYLAVSVGPLILVVGFGLSRARWLGVLALAVIAMLITQPFTRISPGIGIPKDSKSNAGTIAELMAPQLPGGSLVLVSQPEAVPLLDHYLGDDLRYADPRGIVSDPQVMDWRDAEQELAAASVPGPLSNTIGAVHRGDRVLLLSPASRRQDTDTAWIERFRELDHQWRAYLATETCLRPVLRAGPPSVASDYPYQGTLFECV